MAAMASRINKEGAANVSQIWRYRRLNLRLALHLRQKLETAFDNLLPISPKLLSPSALAKPSPDGTAFRMLSFCVLRMKAGRLHLILIHLHIYQGIPGLRGCDINQ
jgi:hypothetical protein